MKIKLIVSLLALCLVFSVVSVQAQTNVLGNMDNINLVMTGNVTETIKCRITGNAVIVDEMDFTDNTGNVTGNMTNVTNNTAIAKNMTLHVTGNMALIRDISNMTEKVVMVGNADNIPGKIVIFGKADNITQDMTNKTGNMTNVTNNMTIITTGNMTGTIMFNAAEGMNNTTGNMNATSNMNVAKNVTVLMTGNMTGNITGDMTRKTIIIKNMGDISELDRSIANTTDPMTLNLTGNMVIIRNMDRNTEMNNENMDNLIAMDGNEAILENMGNITGTNQNMNSATGKVVTIRNMDNTIGITTNTITCGTNQSAAMVRVRGM